MMEQAPINVGIIGLGRAGLAMHVAELRGTDRFRVVAGCDAIPERPRALAEEFGSRCYGDYWDIVADPDVELIVVATRSHTHVEIGLTALEAGKHVLMEKPIAPTLEEADVLIDAAARAPGKLMIRHNRRFDPDFLHVREVIASGILGEVFEIKLSRHSFNRRNDWQTVRRFGGGLLNNWGPHLIDHALQLLGGGYESMFSDLKRVASAGDAEDTVKVIMRGATGLLVDIEVSGAVAIGEPEYRVMGKYGAMVSTCKEARLRYYDPASAPPLVLHAETPAPEEVFANPEHLVWHEETRPAVPRQEVPAFYDLVYRTLRQGADFPITLHESRTVMEAIEEIRRAAGRGAG